MVFEQWKRDKNENLKFQADSNGNPTVRVVMVV